MKNQKFEKKKTAMLIDVLTNKKLRVGFSLFLKSEFSVENLDFWLAVEKYKSIKHVEERRRRMYKIYEEYIAPGSKNQVNLDQCNRERIIQHMVTDSTPHIDAFTGAQRYIFNIMENDSYARFVRSRYFDVCRTSGRRSPRQFLQDILHYKKS